MENVFTCRVCGHPRPLDQAVNSAHDGDKPTCALCWTISYYALDAKKVAKVRAEVLDLQMKHVITVDQQYGYELRAIQALARKSIAAPLPAPVRMAVSELPSSMAMTRPVSGSSTSTAAWM